MLQHYEPCPRTSVNLYITPVVVGKMKLAFFFFSFFCRAFNDSLKLLGLGTRWGPSASCTGFMWSPKVPRWGRTAVHIKLRRAIRLAIRTCRLLFCTEAELPNLFTCKDADPETASSALALDECKLSECLSERAGKAPWYSQSVEKNL